jgi:ubiquitin C-terminal hydrolase
MALKECMLKDLKPVGDRSDVTASNQAYDERLHSSVQAFCDLFTSGQITKTTTCTECNNVSTREEEFSKWLLHFPQEHHEKDQNCTLNDLICHNAMQEDLSDYVCMHCNKQTPATLCSWISWYPVILCIVLCCKKENDNSIMSAVKYPVGGLNPSELTGSQVEMFHSRYNLIATVNHHPDRQNTGRYMAVTKSRSSSCW